MRLPNSVGSISCCVLHRDLRHLFSWLLSEYLTYSYRIVAMKRYHGLAVKRIHPIFHCPNWRYSFLSHPSVLSGADMFKSYTEIYEVQKQQTIILKCEECPTWETHSETSRVWFFKEMQQSSSFSEEYITVFNGKWLKVLHFMVRCINPWGIPENRFITKRTINI